jgi:hypothetical protein
MRTALTVLSLFVIMPFAVAQSQKVDEYGIRVFPKLPPPGVHPRVWITDAERADVKRRLYETEHGKKIAQPAIATATDWILGESGIAKSLRQFDPEQPTRESVEKASRQWGEGKTVSLGVTAIKAWVDEDKALARKVIGKAVLFTQAQMATEKVDPETWKRWKEEPDWRGGNLWGPAMVYDLLHREMTPEERKTIREAIVFFTAGKRAHGMGWPATRLFSNWVPLHGEMANIALAIEGEEGYDPEIYRLYHDMMKGWMDYSLSASGANHEDGYIYYALRGGMPFVVTATRRGDMDLARHRKFRNIWRWMAMWEPTYGHFGGYQTCYVANQYLYPTDPVANMFWARRVGRDYEVRQTWQSWVYTVLYGDDYRGTYAEATDYAKIGLPLSMFDKRRGVLIALNGFGEQDLMLRMHARADSMFVGHAAVDSGSFELQALGREWVHHPIGDKAGSFHSYDYSLVHIDGKAQGMKPPIVNVIDQRNSDTASIITADLTYAYNWQWFYGWPLPGVEGRELPPSPPWEPEKSDPYKLGWPADEDWLPHDISAQPDIGFCGVWQMKRRINDVRYAFRTAIMARGENPYVLIVDDVKQDDAERLYEWYLAVPRDVEFAGQFQKDILLQDGEAGDAFRPKAGTRRLLVRVLSPYEDLPETGNFYKQPNFIRGVRFGEHVSSVHQDERRNRLGNAKFRRLDIPWRGTAGRFVVLLHPYKTDLNGPDKTYLACPRGSTAMPGTSWNQDRTELTVKFGDRTDVYSFKRLPSGRRHVTMTRDGEIVF